MARFLDPWLSEDEWAGPVLEAVQPDIYVKGREYESKVDPRFAKEKKTVESYGGRVVLGSGDVIFSSTEIGRRKRNTLDMDLGVFRSQGVDSG